jgi:hypothetical protein
MLEHCWPSTYFGRLGIVMLDVALGGGAIVQG